MLILVTMVTVVMDVTVKPMDADPTWRDPSLSKPRLSRFVSQRDPFWMANRVTSFPYLGSFGDSAGVRPPCASAVVLSTWLPPTSPALHFPFSNP